MSQGPGVVKISKKNRGRKSRVSVPLKVQNKHFYRDDKFFESNLMQKSNNEDRCVNKQEDLGMKQQCKVMTCLAKTV